MFDFGTVRFLSLYLRILISRERKIMYVFLLICLLELEIAIVGIHSVIVLRKMSIARDGYIPWDIIVTTVECSLSSTSKIEHFEMNEMRNSTHEMYEMFWFCGNVSLKQRVTLFYILFFIFDFVVSVFLNRVCFSIIFFFYFYLIFIYGNR